MEKVANAILDSICKKEVIPEEMLYEFQKKTLKVLQTSCMERVADDVEQLGCYAEAFRRAKNFDGATVEFAYGMGRLFSLTSMLGMMEEQENMPLSLQDYAVKLKDWYLVFKGMHDQPGISHRELASVCKRSISSLSQFTSRYEGERLYISRRVGRGKSYYLTELGTELYELMRSQQPRYIDEKYAERMRVRKIIEKTVFLCRNDSDWIATEENDESIEWRICCVDNHEGYKAVDNWLKISINKNAFGEQKGVNGEWQKNQNWKKQSVIS